MMSDWTWRPSTGHARGCWPPTPTAGTSTWRRCRSPSTAPSCCTTRDSSSTWAGATGSSASTAAVRNLAICSYVDHDGEFTRGPELGVLLIMMESSLVVQGAGRSSEVERSLMVQWVVGSILHGVDLLSYFSFQPVLHDWCNKGRYMCYPVCGMVHIKEPLLLIDKSSLCGGSGFPFSLSEWSLTICLTPYNRR